MRKVLSCILLVLMILTTSVTSFADDISKEEFLRNNAGTESVTEIVHIDGQEYTFVRCVDSNYSRVTALLEGEIVADATYIFGTGCVKELISGIQVSVIDTHNVSEIETHPFGVESLYAKASSGIRYKLDYSANRSFALHGFFVSIEATLLAAMFPGMGVSIAVGIVTAAVGLGLSYIYYNIKQYSGSDSQYYYIKRVVKFYTTSKHTKQIGKTWTGIQKKSKAYA